MARIRRISATTPHRIDGYDPPAIGDDPDLDAVSEAILALDPTGMRIGDVLRETYDQLYDGQRTGRFRWDQLRKTEKTYMGTLVEINLHREFEFGDGVAMDYLIAGADVDCKFSQSLGGWEFPPEAYEGRHLCLVVWASEAAKRFEAGLVRVDGAAPGILGPMNRDKKRKLTPAGQSQIRWLYDMPALPENLLLHLPESVREEILNARSAGNRRSGQARINTLFRRVQKRIVNRASVLTVGKQDDPLKRARDARNPRHLGREGILVLGHQEDDPLVARDLGLEVPRRGQFISVRVVPAEANHDGPSAEIGGTHWRIACSSDALVPAPLMRRASRRRSALSPDYERADKGDNPPTLNRP
jgi:Restriction endonuclease NaeI